MSPQEFRALCRNGSFTGPSAGVAENFVQANLMIVPKDWAYDFLLFCQRNPKPCPLIEVLDAGAFEPTCAKGADLRFDLPGYRLWRDGALVEELADISKLWDEDLVSFLIGCSFSFETALQEEGIVLRHIEQKKTSRCTEPIVPVCRQGDCTAAGGQHAGRSKPRRRARRRDLGPIPRSPRSAGSCGRCEGTWHCRSTAPRLRQSGGGQRRWSCGILGLRRHTSSVVVASGLPFCITHAPGKMFVTDQAMRPPTA